MANLNSEILVLLGALVEAVEGYGNWGFCYLKLFAKEHHDNLRSLHRRTPSLSDIKESSEVCSLLNVPKYVSWEYFPDLSTTGSPIILLHIHDYQVTDREVSMMPRDILNITFPSVNESHGFDVPIFVGANIPDRCSSVPTGEKPSIQLMQPIPRSLSQLTGTLIAENLERINFEETSRLLSLLPSPTSVIGSETSFGKYKGQSTWSLTPSPMVWSPSSNSDFVNGVGMTPFHDQYCYLAIFNPSDWSRMAIKLGPRPWWNEYHDAVKTSASLSEARFLLFQMISAPNEELEGGNLLHLVLSPPDSNMGLLANEIPWDLYDHTWRIGGYFHGDEDSDKNFKPYTLSGVKGDIIDKRLTRMSGKPVYKPIRIDRCNYCKRIGMYNMRKSFGGKMLLHEYSDKLWCKTCMNAYKEEKSELEYESSLLRCDFMFCEDEHGPGDCSILLGLKKIDIPSSSPSYACCSQIVCDCLNVSSVYTPTEPSVEKSSNKSRTLDIKRVSFQETSVTVQKDEPPSYASIVKKVDHENDRTPIIRMVKTAKPILSVAIDDLPSSVAPSICSAEAFTFEDEIPFVRIPGTLIISGHDVPIYEFEPATSKITIKLPGVQFPIERVIDRKVRTSVNLSSSEDRSSDSGYRSDQSKWTDVTHVKSTKTERNFGVRSNIYYRIGRDIEVRPQSISDCISISDSRNNINGRICDVIEDKYFNITLQVASSKFSTATKINLLEDYKCPEGFRKTDQYTFMRPNTITQAIEISNACDSHFNVNDGLDIGSIGNYHPWDPLNQPVLNLSTGEFYSLDAPVRYLTSFMKKTLGAFYQQETNISGVKC